MFFRHSCYRNSCSQRFVGSSWSSYWPWRPASAVSKSVMPIVARGCWRCGRGIQCQAGALSPTQFPNASHVLGLLGFRCHCLVDGELILAPIHLAESCSIAKRCVVEPGATLPPGKVLRALSTVPLAATVETDQKKEMLPGHVDWVKFFYVRRGSTKNPTAFASSQGLSFWFPLFFPSVWLCTAKFGDPSLCLRWNALHHVLGVQKSSWILGVDDWSNGVADAGWKCCFDAVCPPQVVLGWKAPTIQVLMEKTRVNLGL